jgi:hypothetical protein
MIGVRGLKETTVCRIFCYLITMKYDYTLFAVIVAIAHLSAQPDLGTLVHTGQATMKQVRNLRGRPVGTFSTGAPLRLHGHGIFILK